MFLNFIVACFSVIICAIVGFWAQDRSPPTTVHEASIETPSVPPGGLLKVRYVVTRKKDCRLHAERMVLDGQRTRVPIPDDDFIAAPGPLNMRDDFSVTFHISTVAEQGDAVFRSVQSYYCNPLHHILSWPIVVYGQDLKFVIAGPPVVTPVVPPEYRMPQRP